MRKLLVFNMVTADGYFEGANNDISWHRVDAEVNRFIIEQLRTTDTLLFGRKTFEVMENFWPTREAFEQDGEVAEMMGRYEKYVVSKTRDRSEWENTKWIKEDIVTTVKKLKAGEGKDIFIFGSGALSKTLIKNNLVDEFRLMINPLTLGKGRPFFQDKMDLRLLKAKIFGNGNVLLCYRRYS